MCYSLVFKYYHMKIALLISVVLVGYWRQRQFLVHDVSMLHLGKCLLCQHNFEVVEFKELRIF